MRGIKLSELKLFLNQVRERSRKVPDFLKEFLGEIYSQILIEASQGDFSFIPLEHNISISHPIKNPGENIVPRKRVQREFSNQLLENSIAIDAGYLGPEGFTEKDGIVSLSGVLFRKNVGIKRFRQSFLLKPGFRSEHLFVMGAFELDFARLLMFWAKEGEIVESNVLNWQEYGIETKKMLNNYFLDLKEKENLIITLDRPIFPYYLYGYESISKNVLIKAYNELFLAWEKTNIPVYSVISASTQKSILKVLLEIINGDNLSGTQIIIDFIHQWLKSNIDKALSILNHSLEHVNIEEESFVFPKDQETMTSLLYAILHEKLMDGTPYLKDFDVIKYSKLGYGDRSTAWTLNSSKLNDPKSLFIKELAGNSLLSFFYVSFGGNDYSRIEFLGDTPWLPYIHYLYMCSINSINYPFHLDLAHRVSVMDKSIKKGYLSILHRFTGSVAGSKFRSKVGGVIYA